MIRRIVAALSFPMLILALLLAWDAYKALRGTGRPLAREVIYLEFAGAAAMVVVAMIGAKIRHARDRER